MSPERAIGRALSARLLATVALLLACGCGYDFGHYTLGAGGAGGTTSATGTTTTSGAGGFCAGQKGVTFCEDFDGVPDVATLAMRWGGTVDSGGTLEIVQVPDAPSPPQALLASAGDNGHASVSHAAFMTTPSTIVLAYDIRVDENGIMGSSDGAALTGLVMGTSIESDPTVAFFLAVDGLQLGWNTPADGLFSLKTDDLKTKPLNGEWSGRWSLSINVSDGNVTVTRDGSPVGNAATLPAAFRSPTEITLVAGLPFDTANTGTVGVTIDDLVLDLK